MHEDQPSDEFAEKKEKERAEERIRDAVSDGLASLSPAEVRNAVRYGVVDHFDQAQKMAENVIVGA